MSILSFDIANAIRTIGLMGLLAVIPVIGNCEEFKCPDGATDSGYKTGNIVRWCEINKGGRLLYHGPVWRWHRNGALESKENYIYGNADGDTPSWYENGKQSSHGLFRQGTKVGLWKYWDEQGHLSTEVTYESEGNLRTDYYPNGSKKAVGTFRRTGKIGKWTYWDAQGAERAQCDFGEGVFSVSSKPCQVIARELDPTGYSRPVPDASVGPDGTCSLRIANQRYEFTVPTGWVADANAGKIDGAPLVFYRTGSTWRGGGSNLYIRPLFKDGASFKKVLTDESDGFQQHVAEYVETAPTREKLGSGLEMTKRTIQYKPLQETDSPFSIVLENTIHETIAFLDASKEVVLMTVLTSPTEKDLQESSGAFKSLVRSVRMRKQ